MAAGLGFKDFTTGEVLTSADVDGYLMQGIWVFASAAARSAAVTSPQEGNMSYLKDTNSTEYYSGSAWVAIAGAGGSMTLLSTTSLSGATTTISSISQDYLSLYAVITGVTNATADGAFQCNPNNNSGVTSMIITDNSVTPLFGSYAINSIRLSPDDGKPDRTSANNSIVMTIDNYTTSTYKPVQVYGYYNVSGNIYDRGYFGMGGIALTTGITSLVFYNVGGNLSTGTVLLYGVK